MTTDRQVIAIATGSSPDVGRAAASRANPRAAAGFGWVARPSASLVIGPRTRRPRLAGRRHAPSQAQPPAQGSNKGDTAWR
jgi:hypothetical protein